jgi:capsular polysaccharide biosynthesis protein
MEKEQLPEFLESALKRATQAPPADDAAVERVLKRLAGSLPRQKAPLWRLPGVLLDWQFAPAWPRVAALACCAALGFVVGIAGVDRRLDGGSPFTVASRTDIGSIVFEPEALTGARP